MVMMSAYNSYYDFTVFVRYQVADLSIRLLRELQQVAPRGGRR
jgi:hypothetical protein